MRIFIFRKYLYFSCGSPFFFSLLLPEFPCSSLRLYSEALQPGREPCGFIHHRLISCFLFRQGQIVSAFHIGRKIIAENGGS